MVERCDVLVAGGGPAGATAATVLARHGLRVVLLDKARFPRPKLCGGLLTKKAIHLLQRLHDLPPEQGLASGIFDCSTQGYEVFLRERQLFQSREGYPFHFVRREIFDAHLLQLAATAGADVRDGCAMAEVHPQEGLVRTAHGGELLADMVLAADGVSSLARKRCGFNATAWKHNLAVAMEVHLPLESLKDPPNRPRVYAGYAGGGYCWHFPNSDRAVLGVCELARSSSPLKQRFKDFVEDQGLSLHSLPRPKAHPLPYGNYLAEPASGRVLLAGDAAGMVEPLFGEGIYYALRTGELAAMAALQGLQQGGEQTARSLYVQKVREDILTEFRWSRILRNLLYYTCKLNAFAPVKSFSLDGGRRILDIIHGERSFRLFGLRERF